jgi:hypothetical protein
LDSRGELLDISACGMPKPAETLLARRWPEHGNPE